MTRYTFNTEQFGCRVINTKERKNWEQTKISEDEIKIGTWTDGKPIYRKVVKGTVVDETSAFSQEGVTSGKNIIDYYGELKDSWGNWVNINFCGITRHILEFLSFRT